MADNQKYYYMRLKEDFFDSNDAVKIMESMPDGYLYSNILLKLYLKSLKCNGRLMYQERIPYNATVLATLTNHSVGVVEKALSVFEELGLIEILDNGAIYMLDIQNYIGKSSTEADRKRAYRLQIENEKKVLLGQMSGQMSDKITPEIEIEKEIDIETDTEIEREKVSCQQIADLYNDTCVSFPRVKTLSDTRKRAIKARLRVYRLEDFKTLFTKTEASDFLKGSNDRNWTASFDWLIKDSNMAKVLDGNYDNKPKKAGKRTEPLPKWINKEQHNYDFNSLEDNLVCNNPELQKRAEELKKSLSSE